MLTLAVFIAAHIGFLGIGYDSWGALLVAALLLGVVNTFVKPLLMLISLPLILLTFGVAILLINALIFYMVGGIVQGFHVESFGSAVGGAVIVSIANYLLSTDRNTVIVKRSYVRRGPPDGKGDIIDV